MKNQSLLFLGIFLSSFFTISKAQNKIGTEGTIVTRMIESKALHNTGGENPNRRISVYLPPQYEQANKRFPVIYYLHGFMGNDSINPAMKMILDKGISSNKIRPYILVIADNFTLFEGSFYSNSTLTGNWDEFTSKELVEYMDKNFRTIANKDSRGIAGHSMGGYGAFKIGMLHPETFSSVYALSPGLVAMVKEFGPNSTSFKDVQNIKTHEELKKMYYPKVLVAVARAWSPNPAKPPFYCDFPFTYEGDKMVVNQAAYGSAIISKVHGTGGVVNLQTAKEQLLYEVIYDWLCQEVTVEKVKTHLKGIVLGDIIRYEMPNVSSLLFVCHEALMGGVTTSLAMDTHGKALSYALLEMEIGK